MKKALNSYWLQWLFVYFSTFFILLPYICSEWAYSRYFNENISKTSLVTRGFNLNDKRHIAAENYFLQLDPNSTANYYQALFNDVNVDLAIGIITVKRTYGEGTLGYLTQVMAKLDELFKNDIFIKKKTMFLCNVYAGPGQHVEALKLARYFPVVYRFKDESPTDVIQSLPEKEKFDYMYCLSQANLHKPKYILLVEDDALANNNLFQVLHLKLTELKTGLTTENYHVRNEWLYLKLFYPERWQGYGWEMGRLIELLGCGLFGGIFSIYIFPCKFSYSNYINKRYSRISFLAGFTYFILITYSIGRPYFIKWRHYSPFFYRLLSAPDCCSPALVFPSNVVNSLLTFLESFKCTINKGIDIACDSYAKQYGYDRYVVEPNLFSHIGMLSTLKGISMWPQEFIFDS